MQDGDRDQELLRRAAEPLGEHFDTVHIFATRHDPAVRGGTVVTSYGLGNYLARLGQIELWLERQKEIERMEARAAMEEG